jgi:CMP/dCMP kinase
MQKKIITIDGPGGVGKGTVSRIVAHTLGWNYLDSGAIYRVLAMGAIFKKIDPNNVDALVDLALNLEIFFECKKTQEPDVYWEERRVTDQIRSIECGAMASKVSAHSEVRSALLERQRKLLTLNGLVADGRDMGTIVFPEAPLKIYLTASVEVRAERRLGQLRLAGEDVSFETLLREIRERDERDTNRSVAPLKPAFDAVIIDTTSLSIEKVSDQVLSRARVIFS